MTDESLDTTDAGAPPAEGSSAGTDLDHLLAEYEAPTPAPKPQPDLSKLQPVIDYAAQELTNKANERVQTDVKSAVEFVKEAEGGADIPDKLARGFLEAKASDDPSFKKAFENRQNDPNAWQSALSGAQSEFAEEIKGLPSNNIKSDAEAARAAVAGDVEPQGDSDELSPKEMAKMSDQDFDALMEEQIAEAER